MNIRSLFRVALVMVLATAGDSSLRAQTVKLEDLTQNTLRQRVKTYLARTEGKKVLVPLGDVVLVKEDQIVYEAASGKPTRLVWAYWVSDKWTPTREPEVRGVLREILVQVLGNHEGGLLQDSDAKLVLSLAAFVPTTETPLIDPNGKTPKDTTRLPDPKGSESSSKPGNSAVGFSPYMNMGSSCGSGCFVPAPFSYCSPCGPRRCFLSGYCCGSRYQVFPVLDCVSGYYAPVIPVAPTIVAQSIPWVSTPTYASVPYFYPVAISNPSTQSVAAAQARKSTPVTKEMLAAWKTLSPTVLYGQARGNYLDRDYALALEMFWVLVEMAPEDSRHWYFKALTERALGDNEAARISATRGAAVEFLDRAQAKLVSNALEQVQGSDRKFLQEPEAMMISSKTARTIVSQPLPKRDTARLASAEALTVNR